MTVIFYVTYTVYCLGSSKCLHFTAFDFPRIFKLSTLPLARSGNSAQSQCSSEDGRDGKASCYLPHCAFCIETDSGRAVQPTSAVTPSCYRETQPWPSIIGRIDKSSCGELKPWTACMKQYLWETRGGRRTSSSIVGTLRLCRPNHPYTRLAVLAARDIADCGRFARPLSVTVWSLAEKHTYASLQGIAKG
jgi:hypothetical protein